MSIDAVRVQELTAQVAELEIEKVRLQEASNFIASALMWVLEKYPLVAEELKELGMLETH